MDEAQFADFADESVAGYAQDNVTATRWPEAGAMARARRDFERLLPQGLQTPDHYLYTIREHDGGPPVGTLWFAVVAEGGARAGYLYSIRIEPAFRGRGHAKEALEQLDAMAAAQGLKSIGLHVFSFNTGAHALYRSLGYGITGFRMTKPLQGG